MKKILMLTMFALLALSGVVNAQDYRKWNFTNWSSQTIADLQEEAAKGITGNNWSAESTSKCNFACKVIYNVCKTLVLVC